MTEVADDLSDIRAFNQQRGPRCQAGIVLAAMDPVIRASVDRALGDPTIERIAIVRWLKDRHGIALSEHSFMGHTKGKCHCGR